ncbi:hypothetical protein KZ813_00015 [Sphingomonas sp. RHCKR7]|uniref:hypothetical protein n=1 Tax=Sphingomonas folli TaxID=2862497 RepID=UPI001CA500CE|nr:hypothetical protein [Sphingomonas folli]MBW6525221.1 hypothetical protein [Sphingomonas folli]
MKSTFLSAISNILHYGSKSSMNQRSPDDVKHELQALDQAHAQNEAARDSFVALAHTALFAASVSFVGSAVPLSKAVWISALIAGWTLDVVGLLALTISFVTARKAIDSRRAALYAETPPIAVWSDRLNSLALWSFPAALLCLFSFVTANVIHTNEQPPKSSSSAKPVKRVEGHIAPAARALAPRRGVTAANRGGPGTASTGCSAPAPAAAGTHEEIGQGDLRRDVPSGTPGQHSPTRAADSPKIMQSASGVIPPSAGTDPTPQRNDQ